MAGEWLQITLSSLWWAAINKAAAQLASVPELPQQGTEGRTITCYGLLENDMRSDAIFLAIFLWVV